MGVNVKSKKHLKREVVIPFEGEEGFVVPKKGGFGQPDNEDYVMLVTDTNSPVPIYQQAPVIQSETNATPISTGTMSNQPTVVIPTTTSAEPNTTTPTPTPTPIVIQFNYQVYAAFDCNQIKDYYAALLAYSPNLSNAPREQVDRYNVEITGVKLAMNKACVVSAVDEVTPSFPKWDSLDCATLEKEIMKLEGAMAVIKPSELKTVELYNNELASAKTIFITKCNIKTPPPPPPPLGIPIIPIGIAPIGGGFGGGGGGGSQEEGQGTAPIEAKKDNYDWFWLLLGAGFVYYIYKKGKK